MKQYNPVLIQGHLDNFNSKLVIFESLKVCIAAQWVECSYTTLKVKILPDQKY